MLFKKSTKSISSPTPELRSRIGVGYKRQANFEDMYRRYKPEQLEELNTALEDLLVFLEYQKSLSLAFHRGQYEEVQALLKNKKRGNLSYLRRDEGWLLRIE